MVENNMFVRKAYQFQKSAHGAICLECSDLVSDYGNFASQDEAKRFAQRWIIYAKAWLTVHGYVPVSLRIVPRWNTVHESYGYKVDEQADLRKQIWRDFLDKRNWNLRFPDEWIGIRSEVAHVTNGLNTRFYSGK